MDCREKKRYPYSNLSTGGASPIGFTAFVVVVPCGKIAFLQGSPYKKAHPTAQESWRLLSFFACACLCCVFMF